MIWLDRERPSAPVLRIRYPDRRVERSWPVHPNSIRWSEAVIPEWISSEVLRIRRVAVAFESGWSASIVWGTGTYSSNRDMRYRSDPFAEAPSNVEVGVLYLDELQGAPHGWVDAAELAELLDLLARGGGAWFRTASA